MQPTVPAPRPPLGLPPGSVRALLSLMICIIFWLLLLLPTTFEVAVPMHIYLLLTMVLLFFVAHGRSIAHPSDPQPSPLYLPGGTVRLLIIAGMAAVIVWLTINDRERLVTRLTPIPEQAAHWSSYLLSLVIGFSVGFCLRFFRYIHSWLAVAALLVMVAELIIEVFIYPSIKQEFNMVIWRSAVTGIVGCYFGTRT